MGNSSTTLVIRTKSDSGRDGLHHAGTVVTGVAYLQVAQIHYKASSLVVGIKGLEKSCVHYTDTYETRKSDGSTYSDHIDRYARAERNIFHLEVDLANFPSQTIPIGQYEFPFEFELPKNLPSSFYISNEQSNCSVEYKIYGRLARPGMFKADVYHRQQLIVMTNPRPMVPRPVQCYPDTQAVNFCCCVNKGTITLGGDTDKNFLTRGERFRVGFSVKNDSSIELVNVKVVLREVISWRARGHSASSSNCVAEKNIHPSQIEGASMISNLISYSNNMECVEGLYNPYTQSKTESVDLVSSHVARDSYEGMLIQINHTLCIVAETPCCITSPEISMDMYVQPEIAIAEAVVTQSNPYVGASAPLSNTYVNASAPPAEEPEINLSLPSNWSPITATPVTLFASSAKIVGTEADISSDSIHQQPMTDDSPLLYTGYSTNRMSLQDYLNELGRTFDSVEATSRFINDPASQETINKLRPTDLGEISKKVSFPSDKLTVVENLARSMGANFTISHILCVIDSSSSYGRIDLVRALAPLASDFEANKSLLYNKLDYFEQRECASVFST